MRSLNYNHLRYFRAVAREGGLTRAAEALNLSQSALSVQLQKLEHQLGHRLFDRVGRRLELTEAGRIALDYADTVFRTGDELVSTLKGRPPGSRQVLKIGALATLSRNFQLEFIRPLAARSDVELVVRSGTLPDLLAQLEAHALDVVLSNSAAPRGDGAGLRNHLLAEQPVSLVRKGRPGPDSPGFPDILRTEPVLLPSAASGIRLAFDRAMEAAGIRPTVLAEVDDMAMLRLLARELDALALVPPIVVRDELESGVLVEWLRAPQVSERFYAITAERLFQSPLLEPLLADRRGDAP